MFIMLTLITLIIHLFSVSCSPCPTDDWIPGEDESCYLTSSSSFSWFAAQEFCGQHGGYLAEVNTLKEQSFLSGILPSSNYYWLGLSDLAHSGTYTWQHSWESATYTNWASGEPDGGSQHCVFYWGGHQHMWADYKCDDAVSSGGHKIFALCEIGETQPPLNVLWLGNSYTFVNDVPGLVSKLAVADSRVIAYDTHAEPSWTWELHASSEETLSKIKSKRWDIVVLQEQSRRPAYDSSQVCSDSVPYLDFLVEQIRDTSPEAIIQLYLTWGRPFGSADDCETHPQFCDFASMQDALTTAYTAFACMSQPSRVAPVGEAFRSFYGGSDFLKLYNKDGEDHHASLTGSYLSAVTHYAAFFNTSVVGNTEFGGLNEQTAVVMQEAGSSVWFSKEWEYSENKYCAAGSCYCGCTQR